MEARILVVLEAQELTEVPQERCMLADLSETIRVQSKMERMQPALSRRLEGLLEMLQLAAQAALPQRLQLLLLHQAQQQLAVPEALELLHMPEDW